jgi:hypothetical protein
MGQGRLVPEGPRSRHALDSEDGIGGVDVTREELDSPQLLYKFTRLMERQIGEAESLSRALGDALEVNG